MAKTRFADLVGVELSEAEIDLVDAVGHLEPVAVGVFALVLVPDVLVGAVDRLVRLVGAAALQVAEGGRCDHPGRRRPGRLVLLVGGVDRAVRRDVLLAAGIDALLVGGDDERDRHDELVVVGVVRPDEDETLYTPGSSAGGVDRDGDVDRSVGGDRPFDRCLGQPRHVGDRVVVLGERHAVLEDERRVFAVGEAELDGLADGDDVPRTEVVVDEGRVAARRRGDDRRAGRQVAEGHVAGGRSVERVRHAGHQRMVGRLDRVLVLVLRSVNGQAAGQDRAVEVAILEAERGGAEPQEAAAVDEVGELVFVGEEHVVEGLRLVVADVDRAVVDRSSRREVGRAGLVVRRCRWRRGPAGSRRCPRAGRPSGRATARR